MDNIPTESSSTDVSDITAIVATHERASALNNLVNSFHNYYPDLKIVAVDSSKKPVLRDDIKHILTDTDAGISLQRNIALENVKTSLFLLLDDDYICTQDTNIKKLMDQVISGRYNIAGGNINNIGSENYDFHGYYDIIGDTLFHFIDKKNPESDEYDAIFNFFVGETNLIKGINGGWDQNLKYAKEHDDFFLKLKEQKLLTSYDGSISIGHDSYVKHHGGSRGMNCINYFLSKWNIRNKVEIRFIKRGSEDPYINYHNVISNNGGPTGDIKKKLKSLYGDYPIIISGNE